MKFYKNLIEILDFLAKFAFYYSKPKGFQFPKFLCNYSGAFPPKISGN